MRTKEDILGHLEPLVDDFRFANDFKLCLLEVLIDLRTNLKEVSEQLKRLGSNRLERE